MPISVQTNISSLVAQKSLGRTNERLQQTLQRLSTGRRINVAADDAAGSAIATSMNARVRSHTVAGRNTLSAISMAQTAESALGEMSATVIRMRELAVQSANGDLTQTDRGYLDTEFQTLAQEIDRLSESTQFNGIGLLGGAKTSISFQVGIDATSNDTIALDFGGVSVGALGLTLTGNLTGGAVTQAANTGGSFSATNVSGSVSATANSNTSITADTITGNVTLSANSTSAINVSNVAGSVTISGNSGSNITVSNVAADASVTISANSGSSFTVTYVEGEARSYSGQAGASISYTGTGDEMAIGIGGATEDQAKFAIGLIDGMLQEISTTRSSYGAKINRLERSYANSQNQRINLASAESAIVDLDVAKETAALARSRVLVQAGTSVLSQANQSPGIALQLIG